MREEYHVARIGNEEGRMVVYIIVGLKMLPCLVKYV